MKNKKRLYLATMGFPYGEKGEEIFLGPELPYLSSNFCVTVISHARKAAYKQYKSQEEEYENVNFMWYDGSIGLMDYIKGGVLFFFSQDAHQEVKEIVRTPKKRLKQLWDSMSFFTRAQKYAKFLRKKISQNESAIYYSYWYTYKCYGMLLNNKEFPEVKVVTRNHGFDLYNERCRGGRQPFKRQMDIKIDKVLCASEYGLKYYCSKFANANSTDKYHVCRLGLVEELPLTVQAKSDFFVLVSCANVIALKRVDLIVKALALIDDVEIEWIHFGTGNQFHRIKKLAESCLRNKNNIRFSLPGYVENDKVREYYKTHNVDCFITTTTSEGGCPVSIQEAMLFEMPIIGTSIGGIPEMIDGNGILLGVNPTIVEVRDAIYQMFQQSQEKRNEMCSRSKAIWHEKFNIDRNVNSVLKILKEL